MDFSKFLTYDVIIAFVIFIVSIIFILHYKSNEKVEKLSNNNQENVINSQSQQPNQIAEEGKPTLYYFGGHHCPHSNQNSYMYKFITQKFSAEHPNVDLIVLWGSDPQSQQLFQKYNVQYVPTLVNGKGAQINAGLPDNFNTEGKSDQELESVVIENLRNQI